MQMFADEQQPEASACKRAKVESPTTVMPSPTVSYSPGMKPFNGQD